MEREKLDKILKDHAAWVRDKKNGVRADLIDANLIDANLIGANLSGANLRRAYLRRAYLIGAYLRGADLRGADLSGADLHGAYLIGADLSGSDLRGANLSGSDLSGANLSETYLSGANLSETYLSGANLYGAKGVVEISGEDWSVYVIQCPGGGLRIKGGQCRWFETIADAEKHWSDYDNAHGRRQLTKLKMGLIYAEEEWGVDIDALRKSRRQSSVKPSNKPGR